VTSEARTAAPAGETSQKGERGRRGGKLDLPTRGCGALKLERGKKAEKNKSIPSRAYFREDLRHRWGGRQASRYAKKKSREGSLLPSDLRKGGLGEVRRGNPLKNRDFIGVRTTKGKGVIETGGRPQGRGVKQVSLYPSKKKTFFGVLAELR